MSKASLGVAIAVFSFDADPDTPSGRALHVLTAKRSLARSEVGPKERFMDAALRAVDDAGVDLMHRRPKSAPPLHLIGFDDAPSRTRHVTAWFYATAPHDIDVAPGKFSPANRSLKLDAADTALLRSAAGRRSLMRRPLSGSGRRRSSSTVLSLSRISPPHTASTARYSGDRPSSATRFDLRRST